MLTFTLSPTVEPDVLAATRTSVVQALATGVPGVAIDIDAMEGLEAPVIALLITLLRDARQRGAKIVLRAARPVMLEALRVTALEKIFAIEAPAEAHQLPPVAPVSGPRRRRSHRQRLAMLAALLLASIGIPAPAAPEAAPQEIVANIISQNADMQSYQAQVQVDIRLRSFPYVSQHLDGTTYFKRPDNYEVVFDSVPAYAKGFDKIYSDIGDPTSWTRRFDLSLAGRRMVGRREDVVIRLVQKVRGMIDHEDVAVDPQTWHIDEMDWHYYNGGVISMSQEYQSVGGFTVLARQHATIRIPFVHAAAEAKYGDYRTNVAIDDSVFTREKR